MGAPQKFPTWFGPPFWSNTIFQSIQPCSQWSKLTIIFLYILLAIMKKRLYHFPITVSISLDWTVPGKIFPYLDELGSLPSAVLPMVTWWCHSIMWKHPLARRMSTLFFKSNYWQKAEEDHFHSSGSVSYNCNNNVCRHCPRIMSLEIFFQDNL